MARAGSTPQVWAVKVQGLTKSFGNYLALRGVNLEVRQGESVVIFGPNGAGKTTLIKILATIMNPSSGSVHIDGLNLKDDADEIRRRIGVLTHQTFLYGNLTAYENLEFYSRMYDVPDRDKRICELAAMMGMMSYLYNRVAAFSQGMRQRLAIVRALLHKPVIMLLDEPETGLDQQANAMLWEALRAEEKGKRTIIHITHSLERGFEVGERLLILNKGRIVYDESRQALDLAGLKEAYQQSTGVAA